MKRLLLLALLASPAVYANTCTVTPPTVAFGDYDPTNSVVTKRTFTINVRCLTAIPFIVTAGPGLNGNYSDRKMTNENAPTSTKMQYQLCRDAGGSYCQYIFGLWDGIGGVASTPNTNTPVLFYAYIPANQVGLQEGTYRDTVQITVTP